MTACPPRSSETLADLHERLASAGNADPYTYIGLRAFNALHPRTMR